MSTLPDHLEPAFDDRAHPTFEVEAVADELIALVEEFEATISTGQVPRAFKDRLAQIRQAASEACI